LTIYQEIIGPEVLRTSTCQLAINRPIYTKFGILLFYRLGDGRVKNFYSGKPPDAISDLLDPNREEEGQYFGIDFCEKETRV